jgi:hypothetical protein
MLHARDLGWEGEPCVPCTPPGGHGDGWEVFPFGDLIRSSDLPVDSSRSELHGRRRTGCSRVHVVTRETV